MKHLIVVAALMMAACGDSPTRPSRTTPTCQTNNTATIYAENRSRTGRTYDIFLDAGRVATLSPGTISQGQTIVAGVQHYVSFLLTNTSFEACFTVPIPVRCSTTTYYCDF